MSRWFTWLRRLFEGTTNDDRVVYREDAESVQRILFY